MGKIRRAIADFIRSMRVDDKRHPRFLAGYTAGLNDARLEAETTHEDGIIRLQKWPEGHVLWYHGEIVWRSRPHAAGAQCCMCGKKNLSTAEGDGGTECELERGLWVCSAECWDRAVEPKAVEPSPSTHVVATDDLRKRVVRAIFDPGATEGFKGDRDLTTWQTDAVMRALATTEGSTDD